MHNNYSFENIDPAAVNKLKQIDNLARTQTNEIFRTFQITDER